MSLNHKTKLNAEPRDTHCEDKYATTKKSVGSVSPTVLLNGPTGFPFSFGRYEVLQLLGEGTMGAVYLARDTRLDRKVAIKIPKFDMGSIETIERFQREARAMATTHHANLCPVYDVDQHQGTHFLTMAFIDGQTLNKYLDSGKPMPTNRVAKLVQKLALAMQAAHQANIVHRDLKPANIIINNDNEPVIMDFGLARLHGQDSGLTEDGLMLGTPAYMSPEQVKGDRDEVGPASDIYSLGAIMYEMLAGRIPFDGTMGEILEQIITHQPYSLSAINADVDRQLESICFKALSKEPRDRFSTGGEFAAALGEFLGSTEGFDNATGTKASRSLAKGHHRSLIDLIDRVRTMWTRGEYSAALPILEAIAAVQDPEAEKYTSWARQELPSVRKALASSSSDMSLDMDIWSDDFVSSAASPTPTFGLPVAPEKPEEMPRWVLWLIPVPAVVILFLVVLIVSSNRTAPTPSESTTSAVAPRVDRKDPAEVAENRGENESPDPADQPPDVDTTLAPEPQQEIQDEAASEVSNEPESTEATIEPTITTTPNDEPSPVESPSGSITSSERPMPGSLGLPPPPKSADQVLKRHDANGDDILTLEEIPSEHRHHLMRADSNRDGKLTKSELDKFLKEFHSQRPPR